MKEIWKDVVGYESIYLVSNIGNIWSLERDDIRFVRGNFHTYHLKPKPLKKLTGSDGYHFVSLWKDHKHSQHRISRLVLAAFVGPCPKGYYCNHKNGIRTDNRLSNLEWVTPAENNLHAYRVLGRAPVIKKHEDNGFSKLTERDVAEIRRLRKLDPKKWTLERIGKKFGIVKSHTKRIVDYEAWR